MKYMAPVRPRQPAALGLSDLLAVVPSSPPSTTTLLAVGLCCGPGRAFRRLIACGDGRSLSRRYELVGVFDTVDDCKQAINASSTKFATWV